MPIQFHTLLAVAAQTPLKEVIHAHFAIEIVRQVKFFQNDNSDWDVIGLSHIRNASSHDSGQLKEWKSQIERDVMKQNIDYDPPDMEHGSDAGPLVCLDKMIFDNGHHASVQLDELWPISPITLTTVDPSDLAKDQCQAYDIITWHLGETLAGRHPPSLHMVLYGEGRTSKSKVIQTVTEAFKKRGSQYMLIKAAYAKSMRASHSFSENCKCSRPL